MPDLKDWKEYVEAEEGDRAIAREVQHEAQRRVALDMAFVTGSEQWNTYLQHLQAWIEIDEQAMKALEGRLGDPTLADPIETTRLRLNLMLAKGRMQARRRDMELPKELMQRGADEKLLDKE